MVCVDGNSICHTCELTSWSFCMEVPCLKVRIMNHLSLSTSACLMEHNCLHQLPPSIVICDLRHAVWSQYSVVGGHIQWLVVRLTEVDICGCYQDDGGVSMKVCRAQWMSAETFTWAVWLYRWSHLERMADEIGVYLVRYTRCSTPSAVHPTCGTPGVILDSLLVMWSWVCTWRSHLW